MFHASHVPRKHKLRPVTPDELEFNNDSDATLDDSQPEDLDEPWPYTFKVSLVCQPNFYLLPLTSLMRSLVTACGYEPLAETGIQVRFLVKPRGKVKQDRLVILNVSTVLPQHCLSIVTERRLFLPCHILREDPQILRTSEWGDQT